MIIHIYTQKISRESAKEEHQIGRQLLSAGLHEVFHLDLENLNISYGSHGKPYLPEHPNVHYNISHTEGCVVCAVGEQPVGIDIQVHKEINIPRMLKKMVPKEEYDSILASENVTEAFFRQWTLLESYIKWTGEGLSKDLRTIDTTKGWYTFPEVEAGYTMCVYCRKKCEIIIHNLPPI